MRRGNRGLLGLLGPAFVASVAYVDPGNVAANLTAGSRYGYLLVWVLVVSSAMAVLVQYLSAKLGVVTGRSLSSLVGEHLENKRGRVARVGYAMQALVMAVATDVAEVIGGALGLHLLFGIPLWLGGLIVGVVTLVLLDALRTGGERVFEMVISAFLALVAIGFMAGMIWSPPEPAQALDGLLPRFRGTDSIALAAAMLGATVMPHAIYLHSTLAADRHRPSGGREHGIGRLLAAQRVDVFAALLVAGTVNISMVLFAASTLQGFDATDSIESAYAAIKSRVGLAPATIFGAGLLVSGIGSALVGTHAGARIMRDLWPWSMSHHVRRGITIVPAVVLLALGIHPSQLLVGSQLLLSFGIAFALVPLVHLTSSKLTMGRYANSWWLRLAAWSVVAVIVGLNLVLVWLAVS